MFAYGLFGWEFDLVFNGIFQWNEYESIYFFRLLFGGSMPHFFFKIMERTLIGRTRLSQLLFFACERLIYTPLFQALSLYFLAIFEVNFSLQQSKWTIVIDNLFIAIDFFFISFWQGKNHDAAVNNLKSLYWRVLKANWTYLSLVVFINIRFVPPIVSFLLFFLFNDLWRFIDWFCFIVVVPFFISCSSVYFLAIWLVFVGLFF